MTPHKTVLPHLYLKPGEMFILEKPTLVSTVLGSCVAVTLFNARLGMAAICHALLPNCRRRVYRNHVRDLLDGDCEHCTEAFKYVDCAVSMMVEAFFRFGITPAETRVELHGGASMLGEHAGSGRVIGVGLQNSGLAERVITDHGLTLSVCDVGGKTGRKLFFNTESGRVTLQKSGRPLANTFVSTQMK